MWDTEKYGVVDRSVYRVVQYELLCLLCPAVAQIKISNMKLWCSWKFSIFTVYKTML